MSVADFAAARDGAFSELVTTWLQTSQRARLLAAEAALLARPLNEAAGRWLRARGAFHLPGQLPYARLESIDPDGRLRFSVPGGSRTLSVEELAAG